MLNRYHNRGFTLAELLITLYIMGVLATFTIPKILTAQTRSQSNAAAKEAIAMVSGAYQAYTYRQGGTAPTSTKFGDLTPYMNYVSIDTASQMDDHVNANGTYSCSARLCLKLHTGGVLFPMDNSISFGGSATTNAIFMMFDPDGVRTGVSTDGPGKSVGFFLYYNGAITTRANLRTGTTDSSSTHNANPTADPSWFSW